MNCVDLLTLKGLNFMRFDRVGTRKPSSDGYFMRILHIERHRTDRIGWLRAAVLGANDGIVSTASLAALTADSPAAYTFLWLGYRAERTPPKRVSLAGRRAKG